MSLNVKKDFLREVRLKAGLSQREMAKLLKLSCSYVSLVESGNRNPSPKNAKKMSDLLGVSFDDIFFIESAIK